MKNANKRKPITQTMSSTKTIAVNLGSRSYTIHIGSSLLGRINDLMPFELKDRNLFIISDEHIKAQGYTAELESALPSHMIKTLILPPGEMTKSLGYLEQILSWLLENGVTRRSVILTIGGGVIGDLGGFAASIILRGIPFIQIPTTLLAQVDSSVGGKTAIDMPQGKNLVGSFYQPAAVICDIDLLHTLPKRELRAGYAEIVKYALINDPEFFTWLETHGAALINLDKKALAYAIEVSCRKKAEIVIADEQEKNVRALLNLGHTFAHMLEGIAGYDGRLLHGEAVSIGMVMAMQLSVRMGLAAEQDLHQTENHLKTIGLPTRISDITPPLSCSADDLLAFLKRDKKATETNIAFILSRGIGKAFVNNNVDLDDVKKLIEEQL